MRSTHTLFAMAVPVALTVLAVGAAAAPVTSITDLNNFRDTRSENDLGIGAGDRIQFGANVVPNGAAGTTIRATQGAVSLSATPCIGLAVNANFCARTFPFDDALRGPWTLTFHNGADVRVVQTPDLTMLPPGSPPSAPSPPVPFPVSVTITGTGLQPTISFVVPDDFAPDAIRFNVFDKNDRLANGQANVIHSEGAPGTTRSFTVPPVLSSGRSLQMGGVYALNVQLIQMRDPSVPFTNAQSQILRRSNSYFTFAPREDDGQAAFLPTVGPDGVYRFRVDHIEAGMVVFIDPLVAVGYDYATGPGDPNFESVLLPDVGDGVYTIHFIADDVPVEETLPAGQQFFFPAGGVAAFQVRGIEISAGLDPANVSAFVTGLTFVADGAFTGSMTPITREVTGPVLTALGPAEVWVGLKNSDDVGTRLDLSAEVYLAGVLIGSGQLDDVAGGSSGFNNARRGSIPLGLIVPPVDAPSGSVLTLTLSARVTCSRKTHPSGTARLWFNDAQATSRFGATIDEVAANHYLKTGSALGSAPGSGPRAAIDRFLDSKVPCASERGRPFTPFGTWGLTLP